MTARLEYSVYNALSSYSNVHRGSGHFSQATTRLYERAREIVLQHLDLDSRGHVVIFATPRRAAALRACVDQADQRSLSSAEIGLPLGVCAVVLKRRALSRVGRVDTGGGTARLISAGWVVWARAPDRFEAGTPSIINVIAFARALQLLGGERVFPLAEEAAPTGQAFGGLSGAPLLRALQATQIAKGVVVPTLAGDRPFVHLDNSASTPTFEPIWEKVRWAWRLPESARPRAIEEARTRCARFLGASLEQYELLFTANTTEAINIAAEGLRRGLPPGQTCQVISSFLEHSSNDLPWRSLPGCTVVRVPFHDSGLIDLGALEARLAEAGGRAVLVAVTAVSNVLGTLNDLQAIGEIARRHGARLLIDAAQAVAHRRMDLSTLDIDYLAFSGHKVYAPFGTGVLLVRKGLLGLDDAEMARVKASGEENVGGIVALGEALDLLDRIGMELLADEERVLTGRLLRGLASIKGVEVHGLGDPDAPEFKLKLGVVAFSLAGRMSDKVGDALARRAGVGIRWGCHCAHVLVKRVLRIPAFLEWFQRLIVTLFPGLRLPGVARVSLGLGNTEQDVDRFLQALAEMEGSRPSKAKRIEMEEFIRQVESRVYAE